MMNLKKEVGFKMFISKKFRLDILKNEAKKLSKLSKTQIIEDHLYIYNLFMERQNKFVTHTKKQNLLFCLATALIGIYMILVGALGIELKLNEIANYVMIIGGFFVQTSSFFRFYKILSKK